MYFGITVKPATDCVSLYNNSGLISKVSEKAASENVGNCRSQQPHAVVWRPPGNFRQYPHKPYTARNQSHWATFLPLIVGLWVYIYSFFWWAPKDASFCNRVRIGRSRSTKVDFRSNRKGVCDFPLVINSKFGPVLHRFWNTAAYWQKIANFSYPTLI